MGLQKLDVCYPPMSQQCVDPIVGKILAGWRYDISGLASEMRGDYEDHFSSCEHCRQSVSVRHGWGDFYCLLKGAGSAGATQLNQSLDLIGSEC